MAKLTSSRNTIEIHTGGMKYFFHRIAGAEIFAGSLVAQNASGEAVPAADAAGLVILGRAENSAAPGEAVAVKRASFIYDNGEGAEALTVADIGKECFVLDDATVGKTGGTNKVKAGVVLDVTPDGVAIVM